MIIAIMQPYLFPYIGYFQLMNLADRFVLLDDVSYINKGFINRNYILVNGKRHLFTIPLKNASQNKKINELYLADKQRNINSFLASIYHAYRKALNFEEIYNLIEDILFTDTDNISDLIRASLYRLNDYLLISTNLIDSSSRYGNLYLKGQDRIIDICVKEKADQYVNPIGGLALYSKEAFSDRGILLSFLKVKEDLRYNQFAPHFVPNLSIIDVLFFNSKQTVSAILKEYQLLWTKQKDYWHTKSPCSGVRKLEGY